MRLIIYSILEYNEMLIYYFAFRAGAGISILEYNDILGENRINRSPIAVSCLAKNWRKHHEKKGPEGPS